ncbi:hypothetical protein Tco_0144552 [Tanacetum coccineum]
MDEGTKNYSFDHIFAGSNPSVLVDKTKSVGDGFKTDHNDSDTRSAFFTPDSPQDDPVIVTDESEEEEADKEDTHGTSHDVPEDTLKDELEQQKASVEAEIASLKARPSYPDVNQLTTLLVTSLKLELSKLLASHNFASCLPTELKELPSKFTKLSGEIKELKQHVKGTSSRASSFTSSSFFSSETAQDFGFPSKSIKQGYETLNRFATVVENASEATTKDVPSAGHATALPAEGEKNTKYAKTNLKDELVDLLGTNVVTQYYNKKLLFDKYGGKMLKRKKSPRITNCEVLTKKGPITLKIYREDKYEEVILNLKTRLDQLTQTGQELKIDLNKPLKEQDPLNELNELANKKRKRTSDLKDHSRGRLLGSVPEPFSLSVLRRLGSIFTSVYAAVQKLKKDSWKELQFSLVDNSKLNVVYLLNRS